MALIMVALIEFAASLWYAGSECIQGGHLKVPAHCSVLVKSSFRKSDEWSVIEYGWARWSMYTIDDVISDGDARPRYSLALFLQSLVRKV